MRLNQNIYMVILFGLSFMPSATNAERISLRSEGGVLTVPVTLNGRLAIECILDSGASDVSIPADVLLTLMRTGTVTKSDELPPATYIIADGSNHKQDRYRLRSVRVGNTEVLNVTASVTNVKGPLLLGQAFLARLPSWTIDNAGPALVLGNERYSGNVNNQSSKKLPSNSQTAESGDQPACLPNCKALNSSDKVFSCLRACALQHR